MLILIPSGIYFTLRTRFLPFRLFPEMLRITAEKRNKSKEGAISGVQALIVSTATRVGMGNLVGVVAAISLGLIIINMVNRKYSAAITGTTMSSTLTVAYLRRTMTAETFYARPNVAYLFGDNWMSQTLYKLLALVMLFIGGLGA